MAKESISPRFGPEHWVTIRDTGEHVKVEAWSPIAAAYRVRSRKRGVLIVGDLQLEDVLAHPDAERGKHWSRCQGVGCGAPLTPNLVICPRCKGPTCTCGRCQCVRPATAAARSRAKAKKAAPH